MSSSTSPAGPNNLAGTASPNNDRRPIPDGDFGGVLEFAVAGLAGSGLGWLLSYVGSYYPAVDAEMIKVQITFSFLLVMLALNFSVSVVRLHFAWLQQESPYHTELECYRRIQGVTKELVLLTAVGVIVLVGVITATWFVLGIMPLSVPFVIALSLAIAAWWQAFSRPWMADGMIPFLDSRDGVGNWLVHRPGKPHSPRGTWRTFELLLRLPADRTRFWMLDGYVSAVAFFLAWGFGGYTSWLGIITTLLIPAVVAALLFLGLIVALGMGVWRSDEGYGEKDAATNWQKNADDMLQTSQGSQPATVYLGERSDLDEIFLRHPDYGTMKDEDVV